MRSHVITIVRVFVGHPNLHNRIDWSLQLQVTINLEVDRPRLHAVQFSALVAHYLKERSYHLDPSTIKSYRIRLNHFLRWWEGEGPSCGWMLDEEAFAAFAQYVKSRPDWGWWNRYDCLRRIRQVLRWAHRRGYVAVDFSEFVPGVKGNPRPQLPVNLEVLRVLLESCEETKEPERNRAILAVLAGTGVRCEECAAMRVEDIVVYEDGSGLISLPVAKNDDLRTVAFDPLTGTMLCEWIVMLPYDEGPLFPSRFERNSGTPVSLTPHGIYRLIRKLAECGEVEDKIRGPHDLRRMFATTWARALPDKSHLLQKQMGHVNYNTTLRYILSDPTDMREAITAKPATPIALLSSERHVVKPVKPATIAALVSLYGTTNP